MSNLALLSLIFSAQEVSVSKFLCVVLGKQNKTKHQHGTKFSFTEGGGHPNLQYAHICDQRFSKHNVDLQPNFTPEQAFVRKVPYAGLNLK